MPELDVDSARKAGVAVPPASKSEYLDASSQLQPGYVATVDGTDPSLGWTAQHLDGEREMAGDGEAEVTAFVEPGDTLPGQVYLPSQLPDPALAVQAGLPPVKIPEHLITSNPNHIQGPEPSERAILEQREELRAGVLAHREGEAYAGIGDDDGDGVPDDVDTDTTPAAGDAPAGGKGNGKSTSAPAATSPAPAPAAPAS